MSTTETSTSGVSIHKASVEGGSLVRISGTIDEHFDQTCLSDLSGVVVIDLDGVGRITSIGIRRWVNALAALGASYYCFSNVRPNLVSQLNMVPGFAGRGQVLTFYAPYLCNQCGKYSEHLIDLRNSAEEVRSLSPTSPPCPACQGDTALDDLPEVYFSHLSSLPPPTPPPILDLIVLGKNQKSAAPFRVKKELAEGLTALWLSGSSSRGVNLERLADGLEGEVLLVARDLSPGAEVGLARLLGLLGGAPNVRVGLARLPMELLASPELQRRLAPPVKVLSLIVSGRCPKGHPTSHELEVTASLWQHPTERDCPRCGARVRLGPLPSMPELMAGCRPEMSLEMRRYLAAQQEGPGTKVNGKELQRIGKYDLVQPLGTGGMAEVYLARQTGPGGFEKTLVVKVILAHLARETTFVRMFLDEARLAARIAHPNVVQIFEVGEHNGSYFIVMEHVDGADLNVLLRAHMRANLQMPIAIGLQLVADVLAGLHAAHTCRDSTGRLTEIIHRDVTPHNVLISRKGEVKLSDFGIAKANDTASRTPGGTVKGKLSYLSPELILDGSASPASDVFAAGVLLYQCLTLEHPFKAPTELGVINGITRNDPPSVSGLRPELPRRLDAIVARALAKNPADRFPTAHEMRGALREVLGALPGPPADISEWATGALGLLLSAHEPSQGQALELGDPNEATHTASVPTNKG